MKKLLLLLISLAIVFCSIGFFVKSLDNVNFIWVGFALVFCLVICPAVDYWYNYLTQKLK